MSLVHDRPQSVMSCSCTCCLTAVADPLICSTHQCHLHCLCEGVAANRALWELAQDPCFSACLEAELFVIPVCPWLITMK